MSAGPDIPWRVAPSCPILRAGEVHLWRAALDAPPSQIEAAWDLLSEDERRRAAGAGLARHRHRFVMGRGMLRRILATYLAQDPRALAFRYGPYGRPALAGASHPLDFNVSHSASLVVYAVAGAEGIGVDVERLRPDMGHHASTAHWLATEERRALMARPSADRGPALLRCWARKEAYLKATGFGLTLPPRCFDVSGERAVGPWRLHDFRPAPDYVGVFAFRGHPVRIEGWEGPLAPGR